MFSYSVVGAQLYTGDMIFVMISFLILMYLIKLIAWNPITKMMQNRSDKIANDIDSAKNSRDKAAELAQQRQAQLDKTREDANNLINTAKENGQRQREQIVEDARNEASNLKSSAEKDIEQQRQEALANSRKDVASLSIEIATKIISKELNEQDQKGLVDSYIEGLGKQK
ncbi:MAG: F0F1 ATP synthase subunit B [Lentilactobacillus hilgardii]|jgi:F-type H+-transporting ATPase subunit b|uniref:ATP synthase subunit b n=1 Tax=Lentilactobacillus hilgardii TaxID=1588 RepID=A0A6P1E6U5_LENHI|nr:F0F1 ATP synthase subunit B [Lentilactobacillus hilgardii]RRG10089.1 MAG: ATP synthase F0 subunit B [Lactobacillus sp.]EEI70405.1 ATP synthase F0, B subunit [Lentilactobacillus hilgardii ATCC 27305]MBZ2201685.1 ATP synthase F0 subunit B [Lentilactobacillus hilgardii]MBZ2204390.1 ATP synthase F0 subunit B [Lentilactobacillus hilgardii]MCT3391140.1 ATP synthase F0 subunit B [Lentilactobacillus hilgardii]